MGSYCCQSAIWDTFRTEHFGLVRGAKKLSEGLVVVSSVFYFWDTLAPFYSEASLLPHQEPTPPLPLFGFLDPFCVPLSLTGYNHQPNKVPIRINEDTIPAIALIMKISFIT